MTIFGCKLVWLTAILAFLTLGFAQDKTPPVFEDAMYGNYSTIEEKLELNGFTFELWTPEGDDAFFGKALVITSPSGEVTQFEDAVISVMASESNDLNQNGIPDVLIESYSGGAHCCFSTKLMELSEPPQMVFEQGYSECPAGPVDLDGDGIPEFTSCDDIWAYEYCSYAESPLPSVAWKWNGETYEVASAEFPQLYKDDIAWGLRLNLQLNAETVDWTPTPECSALALTLPYLYMDEQALAYEALKLSYKPDEIYDDAIFASFDNVDDFWASILELYNSSFLKSPSLVTE